MAVPGAVTDLSSIVTSRVEVPSGGAMIDAYLARPAAGAGSKGGIIVIHEAFGPVEHIADLARRFANVGFDALAPNLYHRVGTPPEGDMSGLFEKMMSVNDADAVLDLEHCAAYLRGLDGSNGKVGCIGFCSGGRQTLLFASSSQAVDAAVDCWGGFIDAAGPGVDTTPARPTPVRDLATAGLSCPIFLVGGAQDENPSPTVLTDLESRLRAAGKDVVLRIFPDAGHAFLADYRPSYNEKAANDLWPLIINFFGDKLA